MYIICIRRGSCPGRVRPCPASILRCFEISLLFNIEISLFLFDNLWLLSLSRALGWVNLLTRSLPAAYPRITWSLAEPENWAIRWGPSRTNCNLTFQLQATMLRKLSIALGTSRKMLFQFAAPSNDTSKTEHFQADLPKKLQSSFSASRRTRISLQTSRQ